MRKFKTPITYYGGKQLLVKDILSLIPTHNTYAEIFFGGGAVFFAKAKSKVEIINDNNRFVINFFDQVKSNFQELQAMIQRTPHSRALHRDAHVMYSNPHLFTDLERAWAFWVLCNQGYAGKIGSSWGYGTANCEVEKSLLNKRMYFLEDLQQRLEQVQIECTDALRIIELRDRDYTFFYVDPPYFNSNMGHYDGYTLQDFENLLQALSKIKGKFLLSSYPSDILEQYRESNGWYQIEITMTTSASKSRKKKTEVLTANYDIGSMLKDTSGRSPDGHSSSDTLKISSNFLTPATLRE
jgi:DNA adenine methylase